MLTASQAWHQAPPGDHVIGWKVDPAGRGTLLARFPPKYGQAVADHVTLKPHVHEQAGLPPETIGVIVGRSDDRMGVEAMVVQIDGTSDRPDGSTYHITWSLESGRDAIESNDVIAKHGWQPVDPPVPVRLIPALF